MIVTADGNSTGSAGEQENRIVGRSIAIDRDAIEAAFDGMVEQVGGNTRFELSVSEEIDQHGGVQRPHLGVADGSYPHLCCTGHTNLHSLHHEVPAAIFGRVSVVMMAPAICRR